ncbi:hypothetical protein, partial [Eikenella longinqua]|uniref:hypothetical protein n=1 Tax=Eikenella longinqua TaxID=1795827 RepID=UPI0012E6FAA8
MSEDQIMNLSPVIGLDKANNLLERKRRQERDGDGSAPKVEAEVLKPSKAAKKSPASNSRAAKACALNNQGVNHDPSIYPNPRLGRSPQPYR